MNQNQKEKLLNINLKLIEEAQAVLSSQFEKQGPPRHPTYVDLQIFFEWWGKVKSFGNQLGTAAKPWQDVFSISPAQNTLGFAKMVLGTLQAIKHELENDHLETFSQLIRAETFSDLLEQAETLFGNGYCLAAGVLGRAVLEEHLRTTCDILDCTPSKKRPTINDFNQALYGFQHYSKIKMKQIDTLASIGNAAAHNNPPPDPAEVKKMLLDLPEVIDSTQI